MNSISLRTFAAFLAVGLATVANTSGQNCESPQTVIESVRLFDGTDVKPEATIIFECDRIVDVLDDSGDYKLPDDATVVDGTGKTLIPGLIDAHVHVWQREQLERSLDFGVTTVYDMGSSRELAAEMREEEARGENHDRADLRSAVLWVTAPGSHGSRGDAPTLSDPGAATDFVAAIVADGADYIKIIYDHFKMFPTARIPTLSRETMAATVEAALAQNKMAVFHSNDVEAITHAVEAGASGFVHAPTDRVPDDTLIASMLENDIFITPNLSLARDESARILDDPNFGPMLTEAEIANIRNTRSQPNGYGDDVEYESVIRMHNAGIPILVGSDMPNRGTTAGATVHAEMELLVEAGLSPLEAMRSATSRPAVAYGYANRGHIAPGKLADLVLVDGKPDQNILDTRKILTIWKSGTVHFNSDN